MRRRVLGALPSTEPSIDASASTSVGGERTGILEGDVSPVSALRRPASCLCARRGKGIRCGSRLLAELSPASVWVFFPHWESAKRGVGCPPVGVRPRPRDRCAKYDEGGSLTVSVGCVSGGGDSSTRGESSHWRLAGEKRRELWSESQRGVARTSKARA